MVDSRHFAHVVSKRKSSRVSEGESPSLENPYGDIFVKPQEATSDSSSPSTHVSPTHSQSTPVGVRSSSQKRITHILTGKEKINFVLVRSLGNFLLLISLYGVVATFGPTLSYEVQFRVAQARGVSYRVVDPLTTPAGFPQVNESDQESVAPGFGAILAGAKEQVLIPPDTNFSIVIPKLGATSRVIPNVDPVNESEFLQQLTQGVAHAKGTVFPGMKGNVYLFAHSTDSFWNVGRYNAVFYLLKDLSPGDQIITYFEGRRYNYSVERTEIKDASDVEYLVKSQSGEGQSLILQTCWPPGTTWKRLYVIAKPL